MPTAVLVLPILADREEEWRRFAQDLLGDRLAEYEDFAKRMGVRGIKIYFARAGRREMVTAHVDAEEPEETLRRLAASEEPFDEWFKERSSPIFTVSKWGDARELPPNSSSNIRKVVEVRECVARPVRRRG